MEGMGTAGGGAAHRIGKSHAALHVNVGRHTAFVSSECLGPGRSTARSSAHQAPAAMHQPKAEMSRPLRYGCSAAAIAAHGVAGPSRSLWPIRPCRTANRAGMQCTASPMTKWAWSLARHRCGSARQVSVARGLEVEVHAGLVRKVSNASGSCQPGAGPTGRRLAPTPLHAARRWPGSARTSSHACSLTPRLQEALQAPLEPSHRPQPPLTFNRHACSSGSV